MKKISLISGLLIITMLIMYFTGIIDFNNSIAKTITEGNHLFTSNKYDKALEIYKLGLVKNPEDPMLNYNSGQAAYLSGDYHQAITYYNKTSDKIDKYLNLGNSNYKIQQYQQALDTYKEGILNFPQNIELKYNYEFVKKKIEEQNKNNEDQKDKNKDQKDNKEDQENQDQKDNKQDQEDNKQEQENKNNSSMNENDSLETEKNDKEIMQVLEMLEKQEQDSLKNNQEIKNQGKEEKYDW